jgi:small neutral amino acid transporter SnatA (MarC family)
MPRRAMGRWRAVTVFATSFVASDAGERAIACFPINISPFRISGRSARALIGTYEILREDSR